MKEELCACSRLVGEIRGRWFEHWVEKAETWDYPTSPDSHQTLLLIMADPFEVRMRFTSQLQHLSASVNSCQKAAHYALKYRDMDEDLHSCILEQLEKVSLTIIALDFGH